MNVAILYTRAGCHLCDDARDELRRAGVSFVERDVDSDPTLAEVFGERVPVVEVQGRVVAEGAVDRGVLGRALRRARRGA